MTDEQKRRGLQGEEEFLRRLERRFYAGWELLAGGDRRKTPCGYDFEIATPEGPRHAELKTPDARGGQISFTWNEFQAALRFREKYRLVILVADEGPRERWSLRYCDDPARYFFANDIVPEVDVRVVAPLARFAPHPVVRAVTSEGNS